MKKYGIKQIDSYFSSCTKLNYKCFQDLKIRPDVLNMIERGGKWT